MNLFATIDNIKDIGLSQPNIRTAVEGDIYSVMNTTKELKYGVFVITQGQHRSDDTFNYFSFNFFYVDRLVDDLESNRLQIQSIGIQQLDNIIKTFSDEYDVELNADITYNTFTQKFADECAGVYCNLTLEVPKDYYCGETYTNKEPIRIYNTTINKTITDNGEYTITYDKDIYTGIEEVNVIVEVDKTDAYNEGKADGFQEGIEEGKVIGREEAIESLPSLVVNENGTYEGAFKDILVNVPPAKISLKDTGIKLGRSTFTTVPDVFDFNGITNIDRMFADCNNLEYLPDFDFSTVEKAESWLQNTDSLKVIPNIDTSGLKELLYFWQGLKIDTVPPIDCSNLDPSPYKHMSIFLSSSNLVNVGAFKHLKVRLTNGWCFDVLDKISYESCINIMNGLYDFVGNNETPDSNQGKLKVHQNFLDTVGDEISIAVSKGWDIYA